MRWLLWFEYFFFLGNLFNNYFFTGLERHSIDLVKVISIINRLCVNDFTWWFFTALEWSALKNSIECAEFLVVFSHLRNSFHLDWFIYGNCICSWIVLQRVLSLVWWTFMVSLIWILIDWHLLEEDFIIILIRVIGLLFSFSVTVWIRLVLTIFGEPSWKSNFHPNLIESEINLLVCVAWSHACIYKACLYDTSGVFARLDVVTLDRRDDSLLWLFFNWCFCLHCGLPRDAYWLFFNWPRTVYCRVVHLFHLSERVYHCLRLWQ